MDEMTLAQELPQLDASSLVDAERLEAEVKAMYRHVARGDDADLHFEVGRAVALGSGSGTDLFSAAVRVGDPGRVVGVDFTDAQLDKATRLRNGFSQVELVEGRIEELPFEDESFDAVISNGVINLSPRKDRVFAEAARVLRPGGRLAISDIVSGRALKERSRRNVDLWAACIAGAVPRDDYLRAITDQGLEIREVRRNDYRFVSARALEACSTYAVESISLLAVKRG